MVLYKSCTLAAKTKRLEDRATATHSPTERACCTSRRTSGLSRRTTWGRKKSEEHVKVDFFQQCQKKEGKVEFGCFSEGNNRIGLGGAPGLCHVTRVAGAVDLQHVSAAGDRGAHGQEVGPRPADGELGQVGQRLADSRSEQEGAHHLVEGRQVLVEVGVGVETLGVHQVGFARGDLWTKWMENKEIFLSLLGISVVVVVGAHTLTMTMEQVMVTAAMLPWEMVSRLYG